MGQENRLLTEAEVAALTTLAAQDQTIDGRRAQALLSINEGHTYAETAVRTNLTRGQVNYIIRKFRQERLAALPDITPPAAEPAAAEPPSPEPTSQLNKLLNELDNLVTELRQAAPKASQTAYSPLAMLTLLRDNIEQLAPNTQSTLLKQLQSMNRQELLDLDTWKGMAYMITYSAQHQANQTRAQLNAQLPDPLKPDKMYQFLRQNLEKLAPEAVQTMVATLESTSKEDLLDPDTWKGLAYMLGYSAQYQAEQTREQLNRQLPNPLKPDTVLGFMKSTFNRVTPDVAKNVLATLEGSSKEDLLDPDTWKGVWYMLNYSLQYQAEQLKQRLLGKKEA